MMAYPVWIRRILTMALALCGSFILAGAVDATQWDGEGQDRHEPHHRDHHGRYHRHPEKKRRPPRDKYAAMEALLRDDANDGRFRVALLRSYLPFGGRRSVPLPSIEKFIDGEGQGELPLCALVRDQGDVDFSSVEQLLTERSGDEIDLIVELARVLQIPVDNGHPFPHCRWWGYVDERIFNWIFPDATATYWFMPFIAPDPDDTISEWQIIGDFVRERYKSFALYDQHFNPFEYQVPGVEKYLNSTVTDFEMKPFKGSNPFREDVPLSEYGQFKVVMKSQPTQADVEATDMNVVPMHRTEGLGDSSQFQRASAGIPLPLPCNTDSPDSDVTCPVPNLFQVPAPNLEQGVVSNINNAYIVSVTDSLTVPASDTRLLRPVALVMRGRIPLTSGSRNPPSEAPCTLDTDESEDACYCERNPDACLPVPWAREDNPLDPNGPPLYIGPKLVRDQVLQMRYWSICNSVYEIPYPTIGNILPQNRRRENTGCVPDSDIIQTDEVGNVDPHGGWFTVVVTAEDAKPNIFQPEAGGVRNARVGANWIQGVEGRKMLINLRNMYSSTGFENGVTRAEADSSWVTAFRKMGDFYPVIYAICPVERINQFGWGSCVAPQIQGTCGDIEGCSSESFDGVGVAGVASPTQ